MERQWATTKKLSTEQQLEWEDKQREATGQPPPDTDVGRDNVGFDAKTETEALDAEALVLMATSDAEGGVGE